ncbi:MAG: hypothetical protein PVF40_11860, partial [Ectothiorhodospiraceae bacterium]
EGVDSGSLRDILGQQAKTIAGLQERALKAGDNPDAREQLDADLQTLERQMQELNTCLEVLENENDYLYEQLRELQTKQPDELPEGDPRLRVQELEQALAQKDMQIRELKGESDEDPATEEGEAGSTRAADY